MLLCDTALGKVNHCFSDLSSTLLTFGAQPYETPRDQFMTAPPTGFDSTWALGNTEPDPTGDIKHPDGYVIPSGKIQNNGRAGVSCHEHQFITYTEAQSEIKYLLKLKWVKF
jgi:hypothetical protein